MKTTYIPLHLQRLPFELKFFASSNSSKGFHSDYPACMGKESGLDRLYIIKGGPGTGKSFFMRTIAKVAQAHGYGVTYYYCSSDPASLDGVRLEKEGSVCMGFFDGTAPHVFEPTMPGVRDEIINLGMFWNAPTLHKYSDEIRRLAQKKAVAYATAYEHLAAGGHTQAVAESMLNACADMEKLHALARRLVKNQPTGKGYKAIPSHRKALGMTGQVCFDTFERLSQAMGGEVVYIQNYYGTGYLLTQEILTWAEKNKNHVLVSRDPVHTHQIDGIFFTDTACSFLVTPAEDCPDTYRTISLRRYVDAQKLKESRKQLRHSIALTQSLVDGAIYHLTQAGIYHFELEKIYATAMDFAAKEAYTNAFCRQLFGTTA